MKNDDVVGKEIDGSPVCLSCIDKTLSPSAQRMYAKVTKPIKRKDLKHCPWMECECCGCPLELR